MFDHKHAGLLKMYYEYNQGEKSLISNQKTAKSIIPQWILKDWIKKYDMTF